MSKRRLNSIVQNTIKKHLETKKVAFSGSGDKGCSGRTQIQSS